MEESLKGMDTSWKTRASIEDFVKIIVDVIAFEGVDWVYLAQDRVHLQAVVNTVMNLLVP
jgi:hypothetical protein